MFSVNYGEFNDHHERNSDDFINNTSNTKKKSREDVNVVDVHNKKRFVWPELLHKQFISAVFDVGLKFASIKEINTVAPVLDDLSPDQMKSCIQKFRSFRGSKNSSYDGDLSSTHQSSSDNTQQLDVKFGKTDDTNFANVWNDSDYFNAELQPVAAIPPALTEQEQAVVASLTLEIEAIGSKIAAQTRTVMEMESGIVQQMRIYSNLVDTLTQIDPSSASLCPDSCSQSSPGRSRLSNTSSSQLYAQQNHHNSSVNVDSSRHAELQQLYFQQQLQYPFYIQQQHPARHNSSDSLVNSDPSDSTHTVMKAVASSLEGADQLATDAKSDSSASEEMRARDPSGNARTELHAMHEMRAQMDLHRRLFEWKEDQVSGFKAAQLRGGAFLHHPLYGHYSLEPADILGTAERRQVLSRHVSVDDLQYLAAVPFPSAPFMVAVAPPQQQQQQQLSLAEASKNGLFLNSVYAGQYLPPMNFARQHSSSISGHVMADSALGFGMGLDRPAHSSFSSAQQQDSCSLSHTGLSDQSLSTLNDCIQNSVVFEQQHGNTSAGFNAGQQTASCSAQSATSADVQSLLASATWDDSLDFDSDLFSFLVEGTEGGGTAV